MWRINLSYSDKDTLICGEVFIISYSGKQDLIYVGLMLSVLE